ncbi:hypothetical protein KDL01_33795 [Actinospica durhamensis]|uniref:Pilus assembly protein n=1 Tax=Actinospica durhamensis TaxID=1508375 RepID=A0A941EUD6_9ACTN|nr:TadE family type IV pilus minor pilin [Actinospica durhamensis]MBR7838292.1 hypothetical protein [Actinospica durhamensis]
MSRVLIPVGARFRCRAEGSEAGYVTAETALLLPVLLGFGYALTMLVLLAGDQIRCADAAWETARALARGSPSAELTALVGQYAPAGATATVRMADGSLTVQVEHDRGIVSRFLPDVRVSATATVPCELRVEGCDA